MSVLLPSDSWLLLGEILACALILPWAFLTVAARAKRRSIGWLADNIEAHWDREAEAANRAAESFTAEDWAALDELRGNA